MTLKPAGGWGCNSRSPQEAGLCQSLLEALTGCRSFIYSLLLFILRLVFAEGCSSHTHSLDSALPWEQGPPRPLPGGKGAGPWPGGPLCTLLMAGPGSLSPSPGQSPGLVRSSHSSCCCEEKPRLLSIPENFLAIVMAARVGSICQWG